MNPFLKVLFLVLSFIGFIVAGVLCFCWNNPNAGLDALGVVSFSLASFMLSFVP